MRHYRPLTQIKFLPVTKADTTLTAATSTTSRANGVTLNDFVEQFADTILSHIGETIIIAAADEDKPLSRQVGTLNGYTVHPVTPTKHNEGCWGRRPSGEPITSYKMMVELGQTRSHIIITATDTQFVVEGEDFYPVEHWED